MVKHSDEIIQNKGIPFIRSLLIRCCNCSTDEEEFSSARTDVSTKKQTSNHKSCPANIYLLKVNNRDTGKRFKISSKLTIKTNFTPFSSVSIVHFEQVNVIWLFTKIKMVFTKALVMMRIREEALQSCMCVYIYIHDYLKKNFNQNKRGD